MKKPFLYALALALPMLALSGCMKEISRTEQRGWVGNPMGPYRFTSTDSAFRPDTMRVDMNSMKTVKQKP